MADQQDGCIAGLDALAQARELRLSMNALERRTDRVEADKNRLGDRVTASEERMTEHEAMTHELVDKMSRALDSLDKTVNSLSETITSAVFSPPAPSGSALVASWNQTSTKHKSLFLGVVVTILLTPEILKPLVVLGFEALKHWLHIP